MWAGGQAGVPFSRRIAERRVPAPEAAPAAQRRRRSNFSPLETKDGATVSPREQQIYASLKQRDKLLGLGEKREGPRHAAVKGWGAEGMAAKPPANRPAGAGSGPRAQRAKAAAAGAHGLTRTGDAAWAAQNASAGDVPPRGRPSAVHLRSQDAERLAALARLDGDTEELISMTLGFRELLSPASQNMVRQVIDRACPPAGDGEPKRPLAQHVWHAMRRWCMDQPEEQAASANEMGPVPNQLFTALACDLLDKCGEMLAERTGLGPLFDVLRAGIFPAVYADYAESPVPAGPEAHAEASARSETDPEASAAGGRHSAAYFLGRRSYFEEVDALRKRVAELEGQLGRSEDAAPAHAEKALCDMPQPRRREVLQRVFQQRPDAKLLEQLLGELPERSSVRVVQQATAALPRESRRRVVNYTVQDMPRHTLRPILDTVLQRATTGGLRWMLRAILNQHPELLREELEKAASLHLDPGQEVGRTASNATSASGGSSNELVVVEGGVGGTPRVQANYAVENARRLLGCVLGGVRKVLSHNMGLCNDYFRDHRSLLLRLFCQDPDLLESLVSRESRLRAFIAAPASDQGLTARSRLLVAHGLSADAPLGRSARPSLTRSKKYAGYHLRTERGAESPNDSDDGRAGGEGWEDEASVARWLTHHSVRVETGDTAVSEGLCRGRAESFQDSQPEGQGFPSRASMSTTSMDSQGGGHGSWREETTPSQGSDRGGPTQDAVAAAQGSAWAGEREGDAESLASDVSSADEGDDARAGGGSSARSVTASSPDLLERGRAGRRLQFHIFGWTSFPNEWEEDWLPLSPDTTVGDLRQVAAAKTGRPGAEAHSLLLFSHGTELLRDADRITMRQLGFKADPAMTSADRAVVLLDHFACMQAFSMERSERDAVPEAPRAMLAKHLYGPGLQASGIVPLVGPSGEFAAPPVPAPLVEVVMKLSDVQRATVVTALTSGSESARHHLSQLPSSVQEPLREATPDQRATLALLLLRLQESGFTSTVRRGYGTGTTSLQRARAALSARLRDVRSRLSRARKMGAPAGAASDTEGSGEDMAVGTESEGSPGQRSQFGAAEAEAAMGAVSRLEEDEVALRHALELLERTRHWGVVHLRQRVEMLEDVMRRDPEDEDVRVELARAHRALEEGEALTTEAEDVLHSTALDSARGRVAALWQGVGGAESDTGNESGGQGADGAPSTAAAGDEEAEGKEGGGTAASQAAGEGGEMRVGQVEWFWSTFVFREPVSGAAGGAHPHKRPSGPLRRMATQHTMAALTELDGEEEETGAAAGKDGSHPPPVTLPQVLSGTQDGASGEGGGGGASQGSEATATPSVQSSPGGGRRKRRGTIKQRPKRRQTIAAKFLSRAGARKSLPSSPDGLLAVNACERVLRAVFAEFIVSLAGTADPRIHPLPLLEGQGATGDSPTTHRRSFTAGSDDAGLNVTSTSGLDRPDYSLGDNASEEVTRLSRALVRGRGAGRLWAGPRALYRPPSSWGEGGEGGDGGADTAAAGNGDGAEGATWRWLSTQHRQRPLSETLVEFMYSIFLQKYGLRRLAERNLGRLVASVEAHRKKSRYVHVFARFLGIEDGLGQDTFDAVVMVFGRLEQARTGGPFTGEDAETGATLYPLPQAQKAVTALFGTAEGGGVSPEGTALAAALQRQSRLERKGRSRVVLAGVLMVDLLAAIDGYRDRLAANARAVFDAADVDGDGALSRTEAGAALRAVAPWLPLGRARALLDQHRLTARAGVLGQSRDAVAAALRVDRGASAGGGAAKDEPGEPSAPEGAAVSLSASRPKPPAISALRQASVFESSDSLGPAPQFGLGRGLPTAPEDDAEVEVLNVDAWTAVVLAPGVLPRLPRLGTYRVAQQRVDEAALWAARQGGAGPRAQRAAGTLGGCALLDEMRVRGVIGNAELRSLRGSGAPPDSDDEDGELGAGMHVDVLDKAGSRARAELRRTLPTARLALALEESGAELLLELSDAGQPDAAVLALGAVLGPDGGDAEDLERHMSVQNVEAGFEALEETWWELRRGVSAALRVLLGCTQESPRHNAVYLQQVLPLLQHHMNRADALLRDRVPVSMCAAWAAVRLVLSDLLLPQLHHTL